MLLKLCKGLWGVLMLTGWVRLESSMMISKLNNLLTSVCTAMSEIDLWHLLFKLQFDWTQQPVPNGVIWSQYVYLCYVWCHELTHWHRTPTTVGVTQVQLWILFKSSNSCTWRTIIDYKSFCTCCSLTFWQLHKLQSSHIKLFHIINSSTTCGCIWSLEKPPTVCLVRDVCYGIYSTYACVKCWSSQPLCYVRLHAAAWCVVNEQQTEQPSPKYTTFTDQQQTSTAESGSAAMHVRVMTEWYSW